MVSHPALAIRVNFIELDCTSKQLLPFEDADVGIYSIPIKHRVPCLGYIFNEKVTIIIMIMIILIICRHRTSVWRCCKTVVRLTALLTTFNLEEQRSRRLYTNVLSTTICTSWQVLLCSAIHLRFSSILLPNNLLVLS